MSRPAQVCQRRRRQTNREFALPKIAAISPAPDGCVGVRKEIACRSTACPLQAICTPPVRCVSLHEYHTSYFSDKHTSLVETRGICSPRGIECSSPCPCPNVASFRGGVRCRLCAAPYQRRVVGCAAKRAVGVSAVPCPAPAPGCMPLQTACCCKRTGKHPSRTSDDELT